MKRSDFIKLGGIAGLGLATGNKLFAGNFTDPNGKLDRFGIQLYTVRDLLPNNPKGILKQLANFGYKQIESYEGKEGMFWGMGNKGFKSLMDELKMTLISSHCDISKDFQRKVDEAAEIGMKFLFCPFKGAQKKLDSFKKFAEEFNTCGEICKKAGLRFGYHNHDYSFKELEGQIPQDILMTQTDPNLVDFEMDIYWVVTAGQDPIEWLKKYPNRFRACHIKDRSKNPGTDNGKNSVDLGTGLIDFNTILKAAAKQGMQYHFVEQEFYPNGSSLKAAKTDAIYIKRLKV